MICRWSSFKIEGIHGDFGSVTTSFVHSSFLNSATCASVLFLGDGKKTCPHNKSSPCKLNGRMYLVPSLHRCHGHNGVSKVTRPNVCHSLKAITWPKFRSKETCSIIDSLVELGLGHIQEAIGVLRSGRNACECTRWID
jgi:hypothetical protein